ncbi:MAG: lysine--tRNA ligase [Roseiarcus sp.]
MPSDAARTSKAWPFEEARKLVARVARTGQSEVLFETGYGPSGLPHLGTFGEVARTTMVRHAFRVLTGDEIKTRLIAFSDDMDGLRKVPDNIPNRDVVAAHLGKPLTQVPDPFGEYDSFAAHNNARLQRFLDAFGFDYEFASSTAYYKSGRFDAALRHMLARLEAVQQIMLPSLREERAATYSPFLPIHPRSGLVMQVPLIAHDAQAGTISWRDPDTGEAFETPVTGGRCKLQWKPDWAMRWLALGVDYEMAGKDLIDSVRLSSAIARALGGQPPEGFNYELFLDDKGQKISKSKGNGLSIEEWLTYASPQSLSLFMFQKPMAAKRLYFDVIPRTVDEYLGFLDAYPRQDWKERLGNPVWHVHDGAPPAPERLAHGASGETSISFSMLLNLAAVANSDNPTVLWGFLRRYAPSVSPATHPRLDRLVAYAVAYFRDFVAPRKRYRLPDEVERGALEGLSAALAALPADAGAETIQHVLYDIARPIPRYQDLGAKGATPERPGVSNDWFNMLYQVLLGEERGPRFGSFVALYGLDETRALIGRALRGELVAHRAA